MPRDVERHRLLARGAEVEVGDQHGGRFEDRLADVAPVRRNDRAAAPQHELIAALSANGKSTIHNIHQIDRGYQFIDERLRQLGARIERR